MTLVAFLKHLAFACSLILLSIIIMRLMIFRVRIMDMPNGRSAHGSPTPKSGGLAIVFTFFVGMVIISLVARITMISTWYFYCFFVSALLIAGISFYDDIKQKQYKIKLLTQVIAVTAVLASGIVIDRISWSSVGYINLGWLAYPTSFLWILGLTNAFNFMDGLDGLAGGVALIVSFFFCLITFREGSILVYIVSYTIIAGTLGFLLYNFPPAVIFMGDVGSAFLGFTFAVLAIIAARYDHSHTSFFVMPLLLFNFIYDTTFTFFRRLLRGEKVTEAHRTHLYQLFQRLGYSHRVVSLFHYGLCILQGLAALWMVSVTGASKRLLFFLVFFVIQVVYTIIVMKAAKRAGLV
ncbi:MAG: undecaprenyl/decaprenyl-phosphate alpha-N-acetylglucosaminyl 1-phosphate transferase [Candidatus Tectomicrobia bacterium]|uniref:Undecaprenyl/decaprenyl-phosphate alpha-N-acetylglucosaminyl 1-phosphate transferase n=1 Tax=Tectimicrobiota bacterium TaxID=2528274 RepID=A0A933LRC1_UNCTE|nr:undecaprenyl/decaprenyl-phosphate alpha-N-acetylglucosaminyl 1-phosphate transferase [Candidatus Tectomicrobia bacterium]